MANLGSWLSEIKVFQSNDSTFHLFLGTMDSPRSTLAFFHDNMLDEPVRYPPISLETLTSLYTNGKLPPDLTNLQKYIFALLKLVEVTINSAEQETENKEQKMTSGPIYNIQCMPHDDLVKAENVEVIDKLPITSKIERWINSGIEFPELEPFFNILSYVSPQARQQSLTDLIYYKSDESLALLYLLWHLRLEFQSAILRELARQSIQHPVFVKFSKDIVLQNEKTEHPTYTSAFHYLLRFLPETVERTRDFTDLQYKAKQYLSWTKTYRTKFIRSELKSPSKDTVFLPLTVIVQDPSTFIKEIRFIQTQIILPTTPHYTFHDQLSSLIKVAEFMNNAHLIAACLGLSLQGRSYEVEYSQVKLNKLGKTLTPLVKRLVSYIRIKQQVEQEDFLKEITSVLVQLIPSEHVEGFGDDINESQVETWLAHHPYFSLLRSYFEEIFDNPHILIHSLYHLTIVSNPILERIVETHLGNQQINIDNNKLEVQITLIHRYPENFTISPLHYQSTTIDNVNFTHNLIQDFILDFCVLNECFVSQNLLQKLITKAMDIDDTQFWLSFVEYVKFVHKANPGLINQIIDVILSTVNSDLIERRTHTSVTYFIFIVVIQWQKIMGFLPNENLQRLIVALKIILKDEINNFDLESSNHYDVETIVSVLELSKGDIPEFLEMCIQFAFTKPVWEQLARYFISIGLKRPNKKALAKSRLKEIPNYILRDVLGQIALINQIIAYCERNGFRSSFEKLIVQNIYKRGWNVERRLERIIPSLFGNISPRLRSYLGAYLAIDQGEMSTDILRVAGDVEEYQLRERIVRELERYGTADMWLMLTQAYHPDISKRAQQQLKETRMSPTQRSQIIRKMLLSHKQYIRELGLLWFDQYDLQQDDYHFLLSSPHPDVWSDILDFILSQRVHRAEFDHLLTDFILRILWTPNLQKTIRKQAINAIVLIEDEACKQEIKESMYEAFQTSVSSKQDDAVDALSKLGGIE